MDLDKAPQSTEGAVRPILRSFFGAHFEQHASSECRHGRRDANVLGGFYVCVNPAALLGDPAELVEENGLSDPSETLEQHAPLKPPERHAFDGDAHGCEFLVVADKERRPTTCARIERVANSVHGASL